MLWPFRPDGRFFHNLGVCLLQGAPELVSHLLRAAKQRLNAERDEEPIGRKKNRHVSAGKRGGRSLKLYADCDWMRRCEKSEGRACYRNAVF